MKTNFHLQRRRWVILSIFLTLMLWNSKAYSQITIDGNPNDWPAVFAGSTVTIKTFVKDAVNSSSDNIFTQGTSASSILPDKWFWTTNGANDKNDMNNVGCALIGTKLYFFADRHANNGDAAIGIWVFKSSISANPDGTFSGVHTEGDLLITTHFINGGTVDDRHVYTWSGGTLVEQTGSGIEVKVNTTEVPAPAEWTYTPKFGTAGSYPTNSFVEGYVDLSLIGIEPCFTTFLMATANSQSLSSSYEDLAMGAFDTRPTVTVNNQSVCIGSSATFTATASGGSDTGDYMYSWNGGNYTSDNTLIINPATTSGSVTVKVKKGTCESQLATGTLTVNSLPTPTAGSNNPCVGGTLNLTASGGTSYSWTGPNSFTSTAQNPSIPNVTAAAQGVYTVVVTNSNGCSASATTSPTIYPLPTASAGGSQTICVTGTATVSGASYSNGTILWTHNGAGTLTNATTLTPTYTPAVGDAGKTITLTMTVTSVNCGTATATYSVIVDPLPTASAGGSQTICVTGTATVSGASYSNGTILWTHNGAGTLTNATTLTPTYTPAVGDAGKTITLTMTVTSVNCGTATATYSVIVDPLPTASAGGSQTICVTGTATVSGASYSNGTILWTHNGAGTLTNATTLTPTYTPAVGDAGKTITLTMTVTSVNCGTATATYSVIIPPTPTVTVNNLTICIGAEATFTANPVVGTAPFKYSWNGGEFVLGANTYTISATQSTTVTVKIQDANGCESAEAIGTLTTENCSISYCSLTQGFFGNEGGKYCDGRTTRELLNTLLATDLVIGTPGHSFTIPAGSVDCVLGLLPGGGTPAVIPNGDWSCSNTGRLVKGKQGTLDNVLLSQTITLGLNLRLDPNLGAVELHSQYFYTRGASGCIVSSPDYPLGDMVQYTLPTSVWNYITNIGSTPTIRSIYDLANKLLGGDKTTGVSLSDINKAVSMFNEAADECQYMFFPSETRSAMSNSEAPGIIATESGNLTVQVVPNPFRTSTEILVTSPVNSNKVKVEIYDVTGRLVTSYTSENIEAGVVKSFLILDSDLIANQSIFICVVRTDLGTVTKRIIRQF